jgi:hypothetical protein
MAPNSRSVGKMIHKKELKLKISCRTPFTALLLNSCRVYILRMKCYILPSAGPGLRALSIKYHTVHTVALVHDSLLTHMFMHMTATVHAIAENMIVQFQVNSCQAPASNIMKSLLGS